MPDFNEDPVEAVIWMIRGQWVSQSIRAAVELGLLDALDEPRSLAELAVSTGTNPPTLARLVRVLADLGLVDASPDGHAVSRTPRGATLAAGQPNGLRDQVLMQTSLPNVASWQRLADGVRTGHSTFEAANGMSLWDSLRADPQREAVFNASMARRGKEQAAALLAAGDLSEVGLLVDVGGGRGGMLTELLRAVPGLRGVVAERPAVARAARQAFVDAGLADRASGVEADFFEEAPVGGDIYVLANVLHDWDDEDAVRILSTVRRDMPPEGRVWVVEQVLDAADRSFEQVRDLHLVDLAMLVLFGARERTLAEYDAILSAAGLGPARSLSTPGVWNVVEARPRS